MDRHEDRASFGHSEPVPNWFVKGMLWGLVIAGSIIAFDRAWCLGVGAVNWDQGCAHRIVPGPPPTFEIAIVALVFPMTVWRARRRAQGLDRPWDWLRWWDDGAPGSGSPW